MMVWRVARHSLPMLLAGLLAGSLAGWLLGQLAGGGALGGSRIDPQSQQFRDDLLVMIATAYSDDRNLPTAWRRMRQVAGNSSVAMLHATIERFIANSRNVQDIRHLVALAEGLGRLTPAMQPFLLPVPADAGP